MVMIGVFSHLHTGKTGGNVWKHSHNQGKFFIHYKKTIYEGISLKGYIEERAINIANYIIEENATVRQTAKKFGISKSTVHVVVTKQNG